MMLAIDIGGTKIAAALIEGGQIALRRQVAMPQDVARFGRALDELVAGMPAPDRVAVASTGFISGGRVNAVNLSIINFWHGFALRDCLAERFHCPIDLLNDAQAAAWGEYLASEKPVSNFLYLTLSTGVGGGLVVDGRLQIGSTGLAGHIGHTTVHTRPVDTDGACGCGRVGCLEMVASGTAIARQAKHIYGEAIDSREVFVRAMSDAQADAVLRRAAGAVAEAIANSVLLLDVERAVIGGSVGLAPGMLERIQAELQMGPKLSRIPVSRALLGADSGLFGAARWAVRRVTGLGGAESEGSAGLLQTARQATCD